MEYNSELDYVSLHLEFLQKHPNFQKGVYYPLTYSDIMRETWSANLPEKNRAAYKWMMGDMAKLFKSETVLNNIEKQFKSTFSAIENNTNTTYFVTLNFDNETFKSETAVKVIQRLVNKDYIKGLKGIFEYNTEEGTHPHFMARLEVNGRLPKGKLIQRIYQSAGIKNLIKGVNFIDVKPYGPHHDNYLDLVKTDKKQQYLDLDVAWREKEGIPEVIEKK